MAIDLFQADEIVSRTNVNQRLTDIKDMFPVSVANGGTGGSTATLARTNLGVMSPTELYYNASGSSSTIPLSDTIANYLAIEIHAIVDSTVSYSSTVWTNGNSSCTINLVIGNPYTASGTNPNRMTICGSNIAISGTSLTWGTQTYATVRPSTETNQLSVGAWSGTKIYKIVGYKY